MLGKRWTNSVEKPMKINESFLIVNMVLPHKDIFTSL